MKVPFYHSSSSDAPEKHAGGRKSTLRNTKPMAAVDHLHNGVLEPAHHYRKLMAITRLLCSLKLEGEVFFSFEEKTRSS